MSKPRRCLVTPESARGCLPSNKAGCAAPMARTHSELVKFASHDAGYEIVRSVLDKIQSKAKGSDADSLRAMNTKRP